MLPYSEDFIKSVDINKYLNEKDIKELLDERILNFKDSSFMVDYKKMLSLTAIDHYVCKMIAQNKPLDNCLKTYLEKVEEQLTNNPFLFYSLPISKLSTNQLKPYIPNIDKIILYLKSKGNEVYNIYLKFENNPSNLTREEKDKLIEYFYYRVGTINEGVKFAQDRFIRFLLNNANGLGYQALSLIIKYFGYQKCQEDNLFDTQIIIADTTSKREGTLGISSKRAIILSKENITPTTFKNNKLNNRYGYTPHYTEGLSYLLILFHELRHQKQRYECDSNLQTSISYYLAARQIIHSVNPDDYSDNYVFSEIEKDANYYGWVEVEKIIKNYIPGTKLKEAVKNIQKHKYTELIEELCSSRKKGEQKELAKYALCKYLDEAIRQKPSIVTNKYKQFKLFYEDSGKPKGLVELLKLPMNKDYEDFYFEQVVYRSQSSIVTNEFSNTSYEEKIKILEKVSIIINMIYIILKSIGDYKESNFNISLINKNEDFLIGENIKYYKKAARNLIRFLQVSLFLHTDLSNPDPNINKIINEINEDIRSINENKTCNVYDNDQIHLLSITGGIKNGYRR